MRPLWNAEDLLNATGGTMAEKFAATGVSIDTRTLKPGDLFIALVGENGDGHEHVATALAKGAAGAMVHRESGSAKHLLLVDDTMAALHRLGAFGRGRFPGKVAAITGSVGKTTTKEMLRTILSAQGSTHAAVASYNNHWGVPLTLARLPPKAVYCVTEIGMNHPGEIDPLARLVRPEVAVITTVAAVHIGHMGSLDAIANEKASLLRALAPDGVSVLPADLSIYPRLAAQAPGRIVRFGAGEVAEARLVEARQDADGSDIHATILGKDLNFRLPAAGLHMAMNAVAALAACAALGADPAAGARALREFAAVAGRGARERIALAGGEALLLDESYNASATSIRAALAVLKLQPARRRIAVLGDMLELGDIAAAEHAGLADAVAASADLVFACGPMMRHMFEALPPGLRGAHMPDSAELAPMVAGALAAGDAVLVKGSLGSRMKLVVTALQERGPRERGARQKDQTPAEPG
jgi:UDP-N-acetylmuramoyl-tripeptide--D-alanyl-D-alanine ligase